MEKAIKLIFIICAASALNGYTLKAEKSVIIGDSVHLINNVILETDDYVLTCDSALFLRKDSLVYIPKFLEMVNGNSLKMNAEKGLYNIKEKNFILNYQKTEKPNSFKIESKKLEIFISDSLFIYTVDPIMKFNNESSIIFGDTIEYFMEFDSMQIFNKSIMKKENGDYSVSADTFVLLNDDSIHSFFHFASIFNDSFRIDSDSIVMYEKEGYAKTFKRGLLTTESSILYGDTFKMFMKNDSLDYLVGTDNLDFTNNEKKQSTHILCDSLVTYVSGKSIKKVDFFMIKKSEIIMKDENNAESE